MVNLLSTSVVSSVGYVHYNNSKLLAQYNRHTWVIVIGSSCESDATLKGIINGDCVLNNMRGQRVGIT